jgi:hypothetical protein
MRKNFVRSLATLAGAVLVLGTAAGPASAGVANSPIVVNGGWQDFFFQGLGPANGPSHFTSTKPTRLKVTDVGCTGERFTVYDNDVRLGTTSSVPAESAASCDRGGKYGNLGPGKAYASGHFSRGTWTLKPGAHVILIEVITEPFDTPGAGALRVDTIKQGKKRR